MVIKRPGRVEQATSEHQHCPRDTGMDPHPRQRQAATRQPNERPADHHLRRVHQGQVHCRSCQCQCPHPDQADQPEGATVGEEEGRCCRASDQEKDHRVVQSILLGLLAWQDGEVTAAARLAAESIAAAGGAGDQWNVARALQLLGWAAAATGWPEQAAMLFGGSQSLLDSIQDDSDLARLPPPRDAENQARLALGEAGYSQWFAEGYSLSAADAVRYALDVGTRRPRTLRSAGDRCL